MVIGKKAVAALIVGGVSALIVANILVFTNYSTTSSLSFSGSGTTSAFDGNLVMLISADRTTGSYIINIYGYNHTPNINLSITDLIELDGGTKISSGNIQLIAAPLSNNITTENPMLVTFSVTSETVQVGSYSGALSITSGDTTTLIPITYDVKPDLSQPIILVVDGIIISIVLWKLITYFNTKYPKVIIKAQGEPVTFNRVNITQNVWDYLAESSKKPIVIKNIILDVGTIIFGIGLGVLGLPTNEFVNNLYNISGLDALILISIGLGIGSLKEFVDKQVISKYQ